MPDEIPDCESPAPERSTPPRILVVDDEPTLRMGFRLALLTDGFEVELARDGEEALERLRAGPPDLMVLDLRMPGIDGIGVLEELAAEQRWVPTVVASAHMDDRVVMEAIRLGVVDFLSKPVRLKDLREIIRHVLREESRVGEGGGAHPAVADESVARARCLLRRRRSSEALTTLQTREDSSDAAQRDLWLRIAGAAADADVSARAVATPLSLREAVAWNSASREI